MDDILAGLPQASHGWDPFGGPGLPNHTGQIHNAPQPSSHFEAQLRRRVYGKSITVNISEYYKWPINDDSFRIVGCDPDRVLHDLQTLQQMFRKRKTQYNLENVGDAFTLGIFSIGAKIVRGHMSCETSMKHDMKAFFGRINPYYNQFGVNWVVSGPSRNLNFTITFRDPARRA